MLDKQFADLRMDKTRLPRDATAVTATQAQALKDGKVLADDGAAYDTVQGAQDAASSWIRLPPATFNEAVTVDTPGLSVIGSGYGTLIDGGSGVAITISATDITISGLQIRNNTGSGVSAIETATGGSDGTLQNLYITDSGKAGFRMEHGAGWNIVNSYFDVTEYGAFQSFSIPRVIVSSCIIKGNSEYGAGTYGGDDSIFANNNVDVSGTGTGVYGNSADQIIYGNRVSSSNGNGMTLIGTDQIIVNNRVDASGTAIDTSSATNPLLDSNVTGTAN